MNYEDARNAINLAFDYLNKGIWSLFGGPWKDFELIYLPVPYTSENLPERPAFDFNEIRMKDRFSMLLDRFVDEMDLLSVQISDIVTHQERSENLSFRPNLFTVSEISSHIEEIQGLIELIRSEIKPDIKISLQKYRDRVKEIDKNTLSVRITNAYIISCDPKSEAQAIHYKKAAEFIAAYRTLLFEFNSCTIRYNQLNNDKELKPLASVDVSPLVVK